ncbi:chloride channel protein [Flavobacterium sp.]|uniref:chloride channel protein n=1 Tax=Flavobacterium sp. TaxID=239 RepID=UPI003B9CF92E
MKRLAFPKIAPIKELISWIIALLLLSSCVGLVSGVFLYVLDGVTNLRLQVPYLIFGLPFAGYFMVWYYQKFAPSYQAGTKMLVAALQNGNQNWNFFLAPLIFVTTLLTHLFGGSAGREGTAVQMAAGLESAVSKLVQLDATKQKTFLRCALAAGFSAVFGVPLAGFVFAFEVDKTKGINAFAVASVCFCSIVANTVALLLPISHTTYKTADLPDWSFGLFLALLACCLAFGFTARLFIELQEKIAFLFQKITDKKPLQAFVGGCILIALAFVLQTDRYLGLGIPEIESAFQQPTDGTVFGWKLLFTAITLAAGFKGGEVTPLFFIGATLGSFLAVPLGLPIGFVAALGFVAVFGAAAALPITCAVMCLELFGIPYFVVALPVCLLARIFACKKSIYT